MADDRSKRGKTRHTHLRPDNTGQTLLVVSIIWYIYTYVAAQVFRIPVEQHQTGSQPLPARIRSQVLLHVFTTRERLLSNTLISLGIHTVPRWHGTTNGSINGRSIIKHRSKKPGKAHLPPPANHYILQRGFLPRRTRRLAQDCIVLTKPGFCNARGNHVWMIVTPPMDRYTVPLMTWDSSISFDYCTDDSNGEPHLLAMVGKYAATRKYTRADQHQYKLARKPDNN